MTSPPAQIEAHREISLCLSKRDLKKYPLPWRVEEDWTCEITAANGKVVCKIPYPKDLHIAHLIVSLANANHPAALQQHERLEAVAKAAREVLSSWERCLMQAAEDFPDDPKRGGFDRDRDVYAKWDALRAALDAAAPETGATPKTPERR
jgi:hypothetical protein